MNVAFIRFSFSAMRMSKIRFMRSKKVTQIIRAKDFISEKPIDSKRSAGERINKALAIPRSKMLL